MSEMERILAEHIIVLGYSVAACNADGCDWWVPANPEEYRRHNWTATIAKFATHQADLLREAGYKLDEPCTKRHLMPAPPDRSGW